jgi:hypothetical protein
MIDRNRTSCDSRTLTAILASRSPATGLTKDHLPMASLGKNSYDEIPTKSLPVLLTGGMSVRIKLKGAKVSRCGVTARSLTFETTDVELHNADPGKGVNNIFKLASKGGGVTQVEYVYGAADYKSHLQMMVKNDPNAALLAISEILSEQMVALPARVAQAASVARNKVVEAAFRNSISASGTDGAVAKLVYQGTKAIVAKIDADTKNA